MTHAWKMALAGAAVAAVGLTLAVAPAAEAAVCRANVTGFGKGYGPLGLGTANGKANATADWSDKAAKRYGKGFSDFAKSKGGKVECASDLLEVNCVASGRPCR